MSFHGIPQGILGLPKQTHGDEAGEPEDASFHERTRIRGTYILVGVFLAAFITYYFVNWKLLSFLWKIG